MKNKYIQRQVQEASTLTGYGRFCIVGKSGVSSITYHAPNEAKGSHYCDVYFISGRTERWINPAMVTFTETQLEEEKVEWLESINTKHVGEGMYSLPGHPEKIFWLKELREKTLDVLKKRYHDVPLGGEK